MKRYAGFEKTASVLVVTLCMSLAPTLMAKVIPGSMISDNMVLQQNTSALLYGKADAGKRVTVNPSWTDKEYTTKADSEGKWRIKINTPEGGYTPYSITISDGTPIRLDNVLIGEVWLATGQSNMEMPLKGFGDACVEGGYDEVATAGERSGKIRFYTVPMKQSYEPLESIEASWTIPGPNTAAEYSATGWYFAKRLNDVLGVPVGVVRCAYGGSKVESWTPREILETYSDVSLERADIENIKPYYHRPLLMYNAMFIPAKEYTYKGIIWYQGCSNVGAHDVYAARLAKMVAHWRDELGEGNVPFYQVEIAPFDYGAKDGHEKAPYLREAQWKSAELIPNSGIICTNDLVKSYERYNIHPSDKATPGKRLAEMALVKTYGNQVFPVEYPKYKSAESRDGAMWAKIECKDGRICRNYELTGFEVAGEDKVFYPAESVKYHGGTKEFEVRSKEVQNPVAVRYGWRDFLPGNVHSVNYLPLVPFRSDDW